MNGKIKNWLPHIAAVLLFLALSLTYFYPFVFEGKDIVQGDVTGVAGWGSDAKEYHEKTGEYAFWSNAMFGGMPANYTYSPPMTNIFAYLGNAFAFYLPLLHIGIVFIYMFGFYIFLVSIGCKPWLSVVGAIAYAFASYNIIIIGAGHCNKGLVMATMAPVLGGVILCYRKKYLWGGIVTLLFSGINIFWGHQQISYYMLLMILIIAVVYLIYAIRERALKDYLKSSAAALAAALLAVAPAAGRLISTADYTKDTMRGGAVLQKNAQGEKENSGLEIDYAYMWSYGKGETITLMIPNAYGANSHYDIGEDSECYKILRPSGQAKQFCKYAPMYWGEQPFTSGPVYVGAIVCFLFVLGLIVVKGPEKWWILAATLLSLVLSWGKNYEALNEFFFYNLPLYNKFRTPSMALVMAEVTMVALGVLALKKIIDGKADLATYIKPLYISAGITGGLCLIYALAGGGLMNFSGTNDMAYEKYPELLAAIVADRKQMLSSDAWRSFAFIALAAGAIWLYLKRNLRAAYLTAIIGTLIFIDLWTVDKRFLNYESFVPKQEAKAITPTEADKQILQDKDPDYRVLNLAANTFNESSTSYFHKSVGGYSPAKLRRYQDIIDYHFAGGININVLNMLNTRYIIIPTQQGTQQVQRNSGALGNAWFVNEIKWVDSPDEEIAAIKDFDPAHTAFIDKEWQDRLQGWESLQHAGDSAAAPGGSPYIRLTDYANPGNLFYESSSPAPRLAVFSEVFYKTWRAYIDGQETPLVRVNYILRGLPVPAGDHKIEFRCIDDVYLRCAKMSSVASAVVGLVMLGLLGFAAWTEISRKGKKKAEA